MKELFERGTTGPWTTAGLDVQYKVEREMDRVFLSFQCTASESDWWYNFQFAKVLYKDSTYPFWCHQGFAALYHSVRDSVLADIKAQVTAGARFLTILGYSQGGALATLAHEDCGWHWPLLETTTYVFGSPRVLAVCPAVVTARFTHLSRYEVRGDPVPLAPPVIWGYRHVGNGIQIGPWSFPWFDKHDPINYQRGLP